MDNRDAPESIRKDRPPQWGTPSKNRLISRLNGSVGNVSIKIQRRSFFYCQAFVMSEAYVFRLAFATGHLDFSLPSSDLHEFCGVTLTGSGFGGCFAA
jgi:hypothetical protein